VNETGHPARWQYYGACSAVESDVRAFASGPRPCRQRPMTVGELIARGVSWQLRLDAEVLTFGLMYVEARQGRWNEALDR